MTDALLAKLGEIADQEHSAIMKQLNDSFKNYSDD
jgi:hypothetical protein